MPKKLTNYKCELCEVETSKWQGQCHNCNTWNSLLEVSKGNIKSSKSNKSKELKSKKIKDVVFNKNHKIKTGIAEFDRVVGNGITLGSLVLVGGEPGIGKSTLLTMVMDKLTDKDLRVLYVSGEESEEQIVARANRVGVKSEKFYILNETSLQSILLEIENIKPQFIVLDSIQTTTSDEIPSAAGTSAQIREVTYELMNKVKSQNINCFIIGHITKDGQIAGPKILEHMVDTVLYFEGDQHNRYRIVRAIKNRFGSTNEIGIFEMKNSGLCEVIAPSSELISNNSQDFYGKALACTLEGIRPLVVEAQSLVIDSDIRNGKRTTQGIDANRVSLIIAIIEKYLEINLAASDIYMNIAGGIKLHNRDSDLSLVASIISSYQKKSIKPGTVFIGEIGLTGEVGVVSQAEKRLSELNQLNYKRVIISDKSRKEFEGRNYNFELIGLNSIKEVENYL